VVRLGVDGHRSRRAFDLQPGLERYGDHKVVHELAVSQYQGIMLWAEAVRKGGTVEREALIKTSQSSTQPSSVRRPTLPSIATC
jgi:hypothetical protein